MGFCLFLNHGYFFRYFVSCGLELLCAQSFSKNFGLYNDRVGNLTMVVKDKSNIPNIISQMNPICRGMYINPPCHGARIVNTILNNPDLAMDWKRSVRAMVDRMRSTRTQLRQRLEVLAPGHQWSHVTDQKGMFWFSGLSQEQCRLLQNKWHIYLPLSGRMSICGVRTRGSFTPRIYPCFSQVSPDNVDYLARAVHDAITEFP